MVELSQQSRVEPPLSVRAEYAPFVNFAMQQNAVPLLRALAVTNVSEKQATHVVVRVWSDPPVIAEKTLRVDTVDPGTSCAFSDLALTLLREPLRKQAEREEGHLWIEIVADGIPPRRQPLPLSVLAYNEWFGVSSLPEILAAHVLPNDPAVERVLAEASKLLLEKTQDGSLSGYQSGDSRRAYIQAAAIYFARPAKRSAISTLRRASRRPGRRSGPRSTCWTGNLAPVWTLPRSSPPASSRRDCDPWSCWSMGTPSLACGSWTSPSTTS